METNFKDNLYYLRRKNGVTQQELAKELGMKGHTTIQSYECGRAFPKLEKLSLLTKYFDVTIDELVYAKLCDGFDFKLNKAHVMRSAFLAVESEIKSFIDATDNKMLIKAHKVDLDIVRRHKKHFA